MNDADYSRFTQNVLKRARGGYTPEQKRFLEEHGIVYDRSPVKRGTIDNGIRYTLFSYPLTPLDDEAKATYNRLFPDIIHLKFPDAIRGDNDDE